MEVFIVLVWDGQNSEGVWRISSAYTTFTSAECEATRLKSIGETANIEVIEIDLDEVRKRIRELAWWDS